MKKCSDFNDACCVVDLARILLKENVFKLLLTVILGSYIIFYRNLVQGDLLPESHQISSFFSFSYQFAKARHPLSLDST